MSVLQSTGPQPYPAVSDHARAAWLLARETGPIEPPKPRLLDRLRQAIRTRHYSRCTEKAYVHWTKRYIWLRTLGRAKRPQHLPVVLTREEVRAVLARIEGVPRLMAILLYSAGLRLLECCRLRIQDVDFATNQIVVRRGKGGKGRMTRLFSRDHLSYPREQSPPSCYTAPPRSISRVAPRLPLGSPRHFAPLSGPPQRPKR